MKVLPFRSHLPEQRDGAPSSTLLAAMSKTRKQPFGMNLVYQFKFPVTCVFVVFILTMPNAQAGRTTPVAPGPRGSAGRALEGNPPEEPPPIQDDDGMGW